MNTQRIKVLIKAIEQGSLTKAGEMLGYTQSYLTQAMKAYEEEIGFPLLVKTNRGVEATNEAKILLPAMRELIRCEEKLNQEMAEIQGLRKGNLRIGSFPSMSVYWVPQILQYFQNNYPDVVFRIEEIGHEEMLHGLMEGSLDMALMSDPRKPNIDFIPILEEAGLIYDLDCYVWDTVCKDLRRWNEQGRDICVSVNLSRQDIVKNPDVAEHFNTLKEFYNLSPKQLRIEITESAYVENSDVIIKTTTKLREAGFEVEMDDFGSGYSSLNMLKEVVLDRIKLDLRFITSSGDQKMGRTILSYMVQMLQAIGTSLIAEGVETLEQADFLGSLGCEEMQGYYFYKPMPVDEFEKLDGFEKKSDLK